MAQTQVTELVQQVVARAREDAAFREAVQMDPRSVVEREYGVTIPADLDVEAIQQRVQSRFQAVPVEGELSDDQLETISGGAKCVHIVSEDLLHDF